WVIKAISYSDPELKMPPDNQLPEEQIAVLRQWIADGAVWPAIHVPEDLLKADEDFERLKQTHWAWQPLAQVQVPELESEWVRDDIDKFILQKLQQNNLSPAADADKVALIRRLSFDLTGLPPTPEE